MKMKSKSSWDDISATICEEEYISKYDEKADIYDSLEEAENERDKFMRIAYEVMKALDENGQADFVLIKNREVREWWAAVKAREEKERKAREEKERKERAIAEALAKLTAEEKVLLGLA